MPSFKHPSFNKEGAGPVLIDALHKTLLFGILMLAMLSLPTQAHAIESPSFFYRIREKDSLSQLLFRLGIKPIYGKKGHLKLTLVLNPKIKTSRGDKIFPGDIVFLPVKNNQKLKEIARVLPSGEVLLNTDQNLAIKDNESRTPAQASAPEVIATDTQTPKLEFQGPEITHSLELEIQDDFTSLHMTDSTSGGRANLYTTSAPGFSFRLIQDFSANIHSFFKFDLTHLNFAPSANAEKSLDTETLTRTHFALGIEQTLPSESFLGAFSAFSLQYFITYGSELFVHGLNTSSITIDSRPLPSLGLRPALTILSRGHTSLGVEGLGQCVFSSETEAYQIKSGYRMGFGGYLLWKRDSGQKYKLNLGYQTRSQNTSATSQSENQVYAGFSFGFTVRDEK